MQKKKNKEWLRPIVTVLMRRDGEAGVLQGCKAGWRAGWSAGGPSHIDNWCGAYLEATGCHECVSLVLS